jgi:hypothetical protein
MLRLLFSRPLAELFRNWGFRLLFIKRNPYLNCLSNKHTNNPQACCLVAYYGLVKRDLVFFYSLPCLVFEPIINDYELFAGNKNIHFFKQYLN